MTLKLRTALSITHCLTAVATIGLILLLTSKFIDQQFINYVVDNNQQRVNSIIRDVTHQYYEGWNYKKVEETAIIALDDGIIISILDIDKNVVFSMESLYGTEIEASLKSIEENMKKHDKSWDGQLSNISLPLIHDDIYLGELIISYYEPYYYTNIESNLVSSVHSVLNISRSLSLLGAMIIGLVISKHISLPITRMIESTTELSHGNFHTVSTKPTFIREINDLSHSVLLLSANLKKHDILRKRLVSDVSHELRTPLSALQVNLEALIDGLIKPTSQRLSGIYKEVIRITRLVDDLTKLTKYDNKSETLNLSCFNLTEIIQNVKFLMDPDASSRKLDLHIHSDVKNYVGDSDKISQILVNLVSNSIKYSYDDGNIFITAKEDDDSVTIIIKDEGIGIPTSDLPYILERFYRVDHSRGNKSGGAGIGLSITKEIVNAHGGEIEINSTVGKGTEAIVKLPKLTFE